MGFFKRAEKYSEAIPMAGLIVCATSTVYAQERFQVSADGQEVTDTQSKLVWRRCAEGQKFEGETCKGQALKFSFVAAKKHAQASSGVTAWRVPTKDELVALIAKNQKTKTKIDAKAFPGTPSKLFWSARPKSADNLNAWIVDFRNGKVYGNTGSKAPLLRLVHDAS